MSAQLKSVIDRFYGINALLAGKKSALMATCADDEAAARRMCDDINVMHNGAKQKNNLSWYVN